MEFLISKSDGNNLLKDIYDLHLTTINQFADKDRVSALPVLVEAIGNIRIKVFSKIISHCIRELINKDESNNRNYSGTKEKLDVIFQYFQTEQRVRYHIQKALRHSHQAIHYNDTSPYEKTENQYKYTIRSAASLIYITSGVKTYNKIRRIYEDHNIFYNPNKSKEEDQILKEFSTRQKELSENPAPRLPIIFLLDSSISMVKEDRINELNKGVVWLNSALMNDSITKDVIELSIITFNHTVQEVLPFGRLERHQQFLKSFRMECGGKQKKLGTAVHLALNRIDEVKYEYKDIGLDYHQPWIIIITDCDNQTLDNYKDAAYQLVQLEKEKKINVIPIAVGTLNMHILRLFTKKNKAIRMKEQTFPIFFEWIYKNAAFFARSEDIPKFSSIDGWGKIE